MKKTKKQKKKTASDLYLSEEILNDIKLKPEILWPCYIVEQDKYCDGDSKNFPGWKVIEVNIHQQNLLKKNEDIILGSKKFWQCFNESADITFIDKYFDKHMYNKMLNELIGTQERYDNISKNIAICCCELKEIHKIHQEKREVCPLTYKQNIIEVLELRNGDNVHDRFAIMDGEIWHCGASIGGTHPSLNALTHGWKDENNALRNFFRKEKSYEE